MFSAHRETNPHFLRPIQPQHDDDHLHPPPPVSVSPPYEDHNLQPVGSPHDDHFHSRSPIMQHPGQQPIGQERRETNPHFLRPSHPQHDGDLSHPPPVSAAPPYDDGRRLQPPGIAAPPVRHVISPGVPHIGEDPSYMPSPRPPEKTKKQSAPKRTKTGIPVPAPPKEQSKEKSAPKRTKTGIKVPAPPKEQSKEKSAPKRVGTSSPVSGPPPTELGPQTTQSKEKSTPKRHDPNRFFPLTPGQRLPPPQRTNPLTWSAAVFCVIFWLIIIIGGLIVLIVYLVFRPQSPHFDVSSVTLNAAYLDLGYLLNADVTVLANFTNPNKKVHVHFSSMIINLYYGSTLIATQYVEPFSAAKATSRFAAIHMVSSQVRLPLKESQRLLKQMETNGVLFEVKGIFRATSKLGSILTYSYNLYGLCNVMVTRPPDGVLIKSKCRTKR